MRVGTAPAIAAAPPIRTIARIAVKSLGRSEGLPQNRGKRSIHGMDAGKLRVTPAGVAATIH